MRRRDLRSPMTSADVERAQFAAGRLGESYDMREVDDLLDAISRELSADVSVGGAALATRLETTHFSRTWLREGYRAEEVDRFVAWARATMAAKEEGSAYRPPSRRFFLASPRAAATALWFAFVVGMAVYLWTR